MNVMGNACEEERIWRETVVELLVDVLAEADVETVYGGPSTSRGYQLA